MWMCGQENCGVPKFTEIVKAPILLSISLTPSPVLFLPHPDALQFSIKFYAARAFLQVGVLEQNEDIR